MFRLRKSAAAALGVVALTAGLGLADSPRDRATGGGQILVGTRGAGDTIAFTAQNRAGSTADFATGQLTVQDRTGGTGKDHVTLHGEVTCLRVTGNVAKLGGFFRDGGGFTLLVEDNGEGAKALEADMIALQYVADPTCEREDGDDDGQTELARGNVQVHDAA